MDFLPDSEITQITRLQRDAGVQRLSCHFSWPEFCDERRRFHQEFVFDVVVFAAARGFPWPDVVQTAVIAKTIFPQLDGLDAPELVSLLRAVMSERLPNLGPVHRHQFTHFLADACLTRPRLYQAVVRGAADVSVTQLHLEVLLPPTPQPLAQGTELHEWERQRQQTQLCSSLRQKEEQLRSLRLGPRVTLGDIPEALHLDKEGVSRVVRAAVRATEGQMLQSLNLEASLLSDILQLRLQQAALATRGHHNPAPTRAGPAAAAKGKIQTAKTVSGGK
ncbi:uncharacterized protein C8orf74 homolog [Pleuronectes platessa]|uniref:uncharacterized protein C8orf74 homolog n=1 Tax=Pleuronectes platessa TaxID=8262 RepID=UPI00232A6760|nr:uncharacterized protein C8orf74 homolog [Pleuronectes platessa]